MSDMVQIVDNDLFTDTAVIAEESGNDHASVIKLVRNNAEDLKEFGLLDFKSESTAGRPTEIALLNEQQATLLITYMRNNDRVRDFKKRLVKEFYRMKTALQNREPMKALADPAILRQTLLTYTEKVIELEAKIEADAPKIDALERISEAGGSLCVTDAAKALQMRPKDLFSYLNQHGWIYKRPGGQHYLGYQSKVTTGLVEHKVTTVLRPDGSEKVTEQVRITPKGLTKLAQLIQPVAA